MKIQVKLIIGAVIAVIVFMIIILLPNERKLLLRDINSLKESVEKEDKIKVLRYISDDYLDGHGVDFKGLTSIIDEFFKNADSINILMSGLKVKIDSINRHKTIFAQCSLGLRVIAKYEEEKILVFGGVIQPGSVFGYFKKKDGVYKLYSARY